MNRLLTILAPGASSTTGAATLTTSLNGPSFVYAVTDGGGQYHVDWGDGSTSNQNSGVNAAHTYVTGAAKTVTITPKVPGQSLVTLGLSVEQTAVDVLSIKKLVQVICTSSVLAVPLDVRGLAKLESADINECTLCPGVLFDATNVSLSALGEENTALSVARDYSVCPITSVNATGTNVTSVTFGPANAGLTDAAFTDTPLLTSMTGALNITGPTDWYSANSAYPTLSLHAQNIGNGYWGDGAFTSLLLNGFTGGTGTAPQVWECDNNHLDAAALNALFTSLGTRTNTSSIDVSGNPGSATCNPAIATAKGWTVITA